MAATEAALASAYEAGHLTDADQAAVQALRDLAVKISAQDSYFDALLEDARERKGRPPVQDNVSLPTFLKYCEALGLTPSSRAALAAKAAQKPAGQGEGVIGGVKSKLTVLREQVQGAGEVKAG